jgi:hypothetical protein
VRKVNFAADWALTVTIVALFAAICIAVGGFAYWGFTSTGATGSYGSVSMPGRGILQLPAGTVDITFAEDLSDQVIDVPAFNISVVSVSTNQQAYVHFANGSATTVNGVSYAPVGTVSISAAGRYAVDITDTTPNVPNPRLAFGIGSQHTGVMIAAFVIAGMLLLLSGTLAILRRVSGGQEAADLQFADR